MESPNIKQGPNVESTVGDSLCNLLRRRGLKRLPPKGRFTNGLSVSQCQNLLKDNQTDQQSFKKSAKSAHKISYGCETNVFSKSAF